MTARPVVVPLKPGSSDGDPTHRPSLSSTHTEIDPTIYLEKTATKWMQDRGEARPGVKYILEALPHGYALYERPRANGRPDKYLFGHPGHKFFDSPNRFYPHFKHLMENGGSNIGCPCTVCDPRGGVLPGKSATSGHFNSSSASSRKGSSSSGRPSISLVKPNLSSVNKPAPEVLYKSVGRPKLKGVGMDSAHVDEEGTPDVYRNLIDKLKRHGTLDEMIREPLSLDWRAEQKVIPALLEKLKRDPQWIPRVGDFVLYVRDVPEDACIHYDEEVCEYQIRVAHEVRSKTPIWEVGLVGQGPADAPDGSAGTQWYVSQSGVRVEPLPSPNDTVKSLSKQYTYVPVEHTRPFFLWEEYVGQLRKEERHPTIENAFTVAASMSLMGKYRFTGTWPEAQILCHAIYIGSELIAVGDTVRLTPKASDHSVAITDILVVKSIRLKLSDLDKASANDNDGGRPYGLAVWVYGSAFTTVASRSNKEWFDTNVPTLAAGYGKFWPLHPSDKELAVPFSRILGRLYEHDMMQAWLPDSDLDSGHDGVLDARKFSSKHDKRIVSRPGTSWYWADSRADALDLHTINGVDVSKHDEGRNPKEWRKKIKGAEAAADAERGTADNKPATVFRNLRGFMPPGSIGSLPLRPQSLPCEDGDSQTFKAIGTKRRVIDVSDGGEDEIIRQTQIVTGMPHKKHKIQVVID